VQWKRDPLNPLRRAIGSLAHSQRVAIFLDRRVDPDQEVEFSASNLEFRILLEKLAGHLRQGMSRVGAVCYIGPTQTTAVLATVTANREEDEAGLPETVRRNLRRPHPLGWPDLASPREIVAQIADEAGVQVAGIEHLPHDLWPEADLPPLSFAQRMSIVLAGFDLSYQYEDEGRAIRLIPLPENATVRREYTRTGITARTLAEIRRKFPDARISQDAGPLVVDGTVEQHDAIRELLSGHSARPKQPAHTDPLQQRHDFKVKQATLRAVAEYLEKSLGRKIEFDPAAAGKQNDTVSFQVTNATLEELLRAWLQPVGLTCQMDEQRILIVPSPGQP